MRPEELFGVNAGKIWKVLSDSKKAMTIQEIMKLGSIKKDDVISGLGWLGKEGKISIETQGKSMSFKLV